MGMRLAYRAKNELFAVRFWTGVPRDGLFGGFGMAFGGGSHLGIYRHPSSAG